MQKRLFQLKLSLAFMLFMISSAKSQESAIAVTGGMTEDGSAVLVSYNYNLKTDDFIQGSVFISFAKDDYLSDVSIPYNDFTVNAGYYKRILKTKNNFLKISLGLGGVFGYESVNNGDRELENGALVMSESKFIYGAFLGLDTDIYLSDNFSVTIKANEYYHHNSDVGQFVPYLGAGIRYFFN
ncbi:conjugal transfer protein TraO [uncultured Flavobacterium sp.]|mgnify:CR=1 FL=1|uniref:conjugal transfer protein TraO n=1 Tax=uncultured Flavobacterium sp. TaxID=165435 RepID=UPI002592DB55|nr:conjugal transfer protein TraO [uncultured Flavobacterium sp.]